MIHLEVKLIDHLDNVDYFDSELLVFGYSPDSAQIHICLFDMSDIMPELLGHTQTRRDYAFRYSLFLFRTVSNFAIEEGTKKFSSTSGCSFFRTSGGILLDGFKASLHAGKLAILLEGDRGFREINFECAEEPEIYQLPFYSMATDGLSRVSLSPTVWRPLEEAEFLRSFHQNPKTAILYIRDMENER